MRENKLINLRRYNSRFKSKEIKKGKNKWDYK